MSVFALTQTIYDTFQCYTVLHIFTLQHCIILYPYEDEMRDTGSNIPLRLKEFPRAKPKVTPEGKGVYLTIYPESSINTNSISF